MNSKEQTVENKEVKATFDAAAFITASGTKSAAIRRLNEQNHSRGDIAKMLNIRYQHVRNVLITPIKKEMVRK